MRCDKQKALCSMSNSEEAHCLDGLSLLFDLDGTLIDTAGDLAAAMNAALSAAGRPALATETVRHLVGHGALAMIEEGFERTGAPIEDADKDDALATFLEYYCSNIADQSTPYPGVLRAIDTLRARGAKIAICTNKTEKPARDLIAALAIEERFDVIVGGDTTIAPKPDPAPVRLCLERTDAKRAIFIGDSDTDIRAAKASGLPVIFVDFGYGPATLADQADVQISGHEALVGAVEKILNA